jgi:hypothetical protein
MRIYVNYINSLKMQVSQSICKTLFAYMRLYTVNPLKHGSCIQIIRNIFAYN